MKRFVVVTEGREYAREHVGAETPREAAERHVWGLLGLGEADGSHVVTAERDGVVERFTVYVTVHAHAQPS